MVYIFHSFQNDMFSSSAEFKTFATNFSKTVGEFLSKKLFGFERVEVKKLASGSVVVDFDIVVLKSSTVFKLWKLRVRIHQNLDTLFLETSPSMQLISNPHQVFHLQRLLLQVSITSKLALQIFSHFRFSRWPLLQRNIQI